MNVLLIDSTPLLLAGFSHAIATSNPDIETFCASTIPEIWYCISSVEPNLILLDEEFEDEECYALLKRLREKLPDAHVLVTVRQYSISHAITALGKGAAGILPKKSGIETIVNALKQVSSGSVYIPIRQASDDEYSEPSFATRRHTQNGNLSRLTRRQSQILELLTTGASNKQICRQLGLAEGTVKNHLYTIFRLLKVRNRTEAAIQLSKHGATESLSHIPVPLNEVKYDICSRPLSKSLHGAT